MMDPVWMYHKDGRAYLCNDLDFHATLPDADEWENEPFTGDRKIPETTLLDRYNALVDKYNILLEKYNTLRARKGK